MGGVGGSTGKGEVMEYGQKDICQKVLIFNLTSDPREQQANSFISSVDKVLDNE